MIKAAPKQMINYLQIITQGQENKTLTNFNKKKHINKDTLTRGAAPKKT